MTLQTENSLRRPRILEIFDLLFAVPTFEAVGAECLISREDSQIFYFVPTNAAAICTIIADERTIAEE